MDNEEIESESDKRYNKDLKAKSVTGFIEALNLLAKYMDEGIETKYFCGAEHDALYIYTGDGGLPEEESEDGLRLSELGFHWDEDVEGWSYFT